MKKIGLLVTGLLAILLFSGCEKDEDYPDNVLIRNYRNVTINICISVPSAGKGYYVYEGSIVPSSELSLRLNNDNYALDSHNFQVTEGRRTVITYLDGWFDITHERF